MIVRRRSAGARILHTLRWAVFVVVAVILNFPILATVLTSFKSTADINAYPPRWVFLPTLDHYREVLFGGNADFVGYIWNSFLIATGGTVLAIALTLPAAYAMVRFGMGARALLPVVTNLRALPLIIFVIPFYFMYQTLGLLDTRLGLALIACVINIPVAIVIFVGYLQDMPTELDAAARIDGAGTFGILRYIIVPLARPMILTVAMLSFIYAWNEFLFGLILTSREAIPVTVGATFFVTSYGVRWGATAAAMSLGAVLPLVLGLFVYPYIGRSMLGGALKG